MDARITLADRSKLHLHGPKLSTLQGGYHSRGGQCVVATYMVFSLPCQYKTIFYLDTQSHSFTQFQHHEVVHSTVHFGHQSPGSNSWPEMEVATATAPSPSPCPYGSQVSSFIREGQLQGTRDCIQDFNIYKWHPHPPGWPNACYTADKGSGFGGTDWESGLPAFVPFLLNVSACTIVFLIYN